ncbi:MAG TPA: hypothetical protein VLA72_00920, partial [Anaerolineales bacterium]|nr:hypothetical protein [Anaerolineales bacterium]
MKSRKKIKKLLPETFRFRLPAKKEYIDLFVEFYNLRLKVDTKPLKKENVKFARDSLIPQGRVISQFVLQDDLSRRKLKEFFEEYTNVAWLKDKENASNMISKLSNTNIKPEAVGFIIGKTGTLGLYEIFNNETWWDSEDCREFLYDYRRIEDVIEGILVRNEVRHDNLDWLYELGNVVCASGFILEKSKQSPDGYYDLD